MGTQPISEEGTQGKSGSRIHVRTCVDKWHSAVTIARGPPSCDPAGPSKTWLLGAEVHAPKARGAPYDDATWQRRGSRNKKQTSDHDEHGIAAGQLPPHPPGGAKKLQQHHPKLLLILHGSTGKLEYVGSRLALS